MKFKQQSFFPHDTAETMSKTCRRTKSKSIRFSHITLIRDGTQGIPDTGAQDITYSRLYETCFAFKPGDTQTFVCDEENFTITFHGYDEDYICFSICNSKNFNEQLVTAIDKKSKQQVSDDLELQYYSFVCIERKHHYLAYIYNKNIKDINRLLQTYLFKYEECIVAPLEIDNIKKRIQAAHKLGALTFTLDSDANQQTNLMLNKIFAWDSALTNFKVTVSIRATKHLMEEVLDSSKLTMNTKRPKLEVYDNPESNKQVIDLLSDRFNLQTTIPADKINMKEVDSIFDTLKGSFSVATGVSKR